MAADHHSLIQAEHELQRAQLGSDTDALERLLHNHLRFVGPDTGVHGKTADLSAHEGGLVVFKASNPIDVEAHVFGTMGLSIALIDLEIEVSGELVTGECRYTRTWLYEDDRWQVVGGGVVAVPK